MWDPLLGDDALLLSVSGIGSVPAPTICDFLGDCTCFSTTSSVQLTRAKLVVRHRRAGQQGDQQGRRSRPGAGIQVGQQRVRTTSSRRNYSTS